MSDHFDDLPNSYLVAKMLELEKEFREKKREEEFQDFLKLRIPGVPNKLNEYWNKFDNDPKFRQKMIHVHGVLNGTYDRNKQKQQDYYIVRVGEVLLFKRFEALEAVFELEHHPNSKKHAYKFDDLEKAEKTAKFVGGDVSKYEKDEMDASEKPKTNIRIYHGYQEFKFKKEDGQ
ncbi:hypothetical protein FFD13_11965 [Listeria monocytogenes]|nr:hypothetical protein [Listeria monocytogenes]